MDKKTNIHSDLQRNHDLTRNVYDLASQDSSDRKENVLSTHKNEDTSEEDTAEAKSKLDEVGVVKEPLSDEDEEIPKEVEVKEGKETNGIETPRSTDILSGRGAGVNLHQGNIFFRKIIEKNKNDYLISDPGEKKRIIKRIVKEVNERGRFLRQDSKSDLWFVIPTIEARKKVGQALRENATKLKKQCESGQKSEKRDIAEYQTQRVAAAAVASLNRPPNFVTPPTRSRDVDFPFQNHSVWHTIQPQVFPNHESGMSELICLTMGEIQHKQRLLNDYQKRLDKEVRMLHSYMCGSTASLFSLNSSVPRQMSQTTEALLRQRQRDLSANNAVHVSFDSTDANAPPCKKIRVINDRLSN